MFNSPSAGTKQGCGFMYLGVETPDEAGICTATLWFTLFGFPIIPVRRERIVFGPKQPGTGEQGKVGTHRPYHVFDVLPLCPKSILKTYLLTWCVIVPLSVLPLALGVLDVWASLGELFLIIGIIWMLAVLIGAAMIRERNIELSAKSSTEKGQWKRTSDAS